MNENMNTKKNRKPSKIIVFIRGGLGNQMFEYACARSMQIEYGIEKLILNISETKLREDRCLGLQNFILNNNIEYDLNKSKYSRQYNPFIRVFMKVVPRLTYRFFSKNYVYLWDRYDYINMLAGSNNILYGYWQSEKYFNKNSEIIKNEFQFKNSISDKDELELKKIKGCNSVCVHMRFGDYLKEKNLYICNLDYFKKAIDYMKRNVKKPKFFIFSDDVGIAKTFLENIPSVEYEIASSSRKDFEELRLMSQCKHFIISNSTFSWWAQYLSQNNKSKIVVAPSRWTKNKICKDVYQENWILF